MNNVLAALANIGNIFSEKLKQKIDTVRAPKAIKDNIFVGSPMENGANASIEITIDHPAAAAFEWGSGIHGKKGEKYWILPKNKGALAFLWPGHTADFPRRGKYLGPGEDGERLVFSYVEHPGVEERPFIKPTIDDTKEEFKKILGQGFKAELLAGTNKVEVIEVK
jgi:hypothetical protein